MTLVHESDLVHFDRELESETESQLFRQEQARLML